MGGIPTTWRELIEASPEIPDVELEHLGQLVRESRQQTDPDKLAEGLYGAAWILIERSVLLGPDRIAPFVGLLREHAERAAMAIWRTPRGHHDLSKLRLMLVLHAFSCSGIPLSPEARLAERWLSLTTQPAPLLDNHRRLLALAALAVGGDERLAEMTRKKIPARITHGKTFGFDIIKLALWLAGARRAGVSPEVVEPAFEGFLDHFPPRLATEGLGYFDLLLIARGFYCGVMGRPVGSVLASLHAAAHGCPLPEVLRRPVGPQTAAAAWRELRRDLEGRRAEVLAEHEEELARFESMAREAAEARDSGQTLKAWRLPHWSAPARLLLEAHLWHGAERRDEVQMRALPFLEAELRDMRVSERGDAGRALGLIAYVQVCECLGISPGEPTGEQTRRLVDELTPLAEEIGDSWNVSLALVALSLNDPALACRALSISNPSRCDWRSRRFGMDEAALIRAVAAALAGGRSPSDVEDAVWDFLTEVPTMVRHRSISPVVALQLMRVFLGWTRGAEPAEVGAHLHHLANEPSGPTVRELLVTCPPDLRLLLVHGHEWGPNGPMGHHVLFADASGACHLTVRQMGKVRAWTFQVQPDVVRRAMHALGEAGFPERPVPGPLRPDTAPVAVAVRSADGSATASVQVAGHPPLEASVARLVALCLRTAGAIRAGDGAADEIHGLTTATPIPPGPAVRWEPTGDPTAPLIAQVDGHEWRVRVIGAGGRLITSLAVDDLLIAHITPEAWPADWHDPRNEDSGDGP